MYDRLRREETSGELKLWVREIEFLSKFNKNLSEEINLVVDQLRKNMQNIYLENFNYRMSQKSSF